MIEVIELAIEAFLLYQVYYLDKRVTELEKKRGRK